MRRCGTPPSSTPRRHWPPLPTAPAPKVSAPLSPVPRPRVARAILLAVLLAATAAETQARVPRREVASSPDLTPKPAFPLAGERVPEGTARLQVATGAGAKDVRVVLARWPF